MDKVVHLCSRTVMDKVFVTCALVCLFGCGSKKGTAEDADSADAIKTPATAEQAAQLLDLSTFPLMDGAKPPDSRHVANLSYVATGDVKKAFEFHRKTLLAQGWKELPNSSVTDQSASATFSRNVENLHYVDQPPELNFETTANQDAIVDFYRKTLATKGWQSTLDHTVAVDETPTMIFRNPAKDMLTLSMAAPYGGKLPVSVRFQSAAEIAELDRKIKEQAPKLRAAAEKKAAEEAARLAENNKVPKVAVTLPADAKDVKQTKDEIKFTVGKGKAKVAVESLRTQFREAGWKENFA